MSSALHDGPGQPAPQLCRRCGAVALAGSRYCPRCGRPLAGRDARYWLAVAPIVLVALGWLASSYWAAARSAVALPAAPSLTPAATPTASLTPTARPPTAAPTPLATSVTFERTLIEEQFEQGGQGILETGEANGVSYVLAHGAYVILVGKPNQIAWSPIRGRYVDAAAQIDVTFDAAARDTAAGLLFRYQDASNFYFFNISADGHYALDLLKDGSWSPLIDWTASPQIRRPGGPNRLRVEMAGDQISLYLNGALLDQASDTTFSSGRMALAVNTFAEGGATVLFDNLLVQGSGE